MKGEKGCAVVRIPEGFHGFGCRTPQDSVLQRRPARRGQQGFIRIRIHGKHQGRRAAIRTMYLVQPLLTGLVQAFTGPELVPAAFGQFDDQGSACRQVFFPA